MGQTLKTFSTSLNNKCQNNNNNHHKSDSKLPDLASWPPELSLNVLKNLNATELCLAACVWTELGRDDLLWQQLCYSEWPHTSIYNSKNKPPDFNYLKLYLTLDEATVTFNADCFLGMNYFIKYELIEDDTNEIAKLFFHSKQLDRRQVRRYLQSDLDVLEPLIQLFDFTEQTLPNALRIFFTLLEIPQRYDHYLHKIVDKFAWRYAQCNPPNSNSINRYPSETIYVLCFSLIMLSADLYNPHIKNKMSKREFIRNVRRALRVKDDDFYGHLYDDVYLRGHIAINNENGPLSNKPSQYINKPPLNIVATSPRQNQSQLHQFILFNHDHNDRFHIIHD